MGVEGQCQALAVVILENRVSILQEHGWVRGPAWTGAENFDVAKNR
jgi:hypothetical protein